MYCYAVALFFADSAAPSYLAPAMSLTPKCVNCKDRPVGFSRYCMACAGKAQQVAVTAAVSDAKNGGAWCVRVDVPNLGRGVFDPELKPILACIDCRAPFDVLPAAVVGEVYPACPNIETCRVSHDYWLKRPNLERQRFGEVRRHILSGAAAPVAIWMANELIASRGIAAPAVEPGLPVVVWDAFGNSPDHVKRRAQAMADIARDAARLAVADDSD